MKIIKDQTFPLERALYNLKDATLDNVKFDGVEDGESALKECRNLTIKNTYFNLRYPLWHAHNVTLENIDMTQNCRAALWYDKDTTIVNSKLHGIKALRECVNSKIEGSDIDSPEFGWRSRGIVLTNSSLVSEYAFFEASDLKIDRLTFKGKYSFQYIKNMEITNSRLDTKDAFWHTKNVVVKDSVLIGEYLAWYSENLTLINCKIKGTQPFCYCKNLKLINCTMEDTDFSFEYCSVEADVKGSILSVKNPLKGLIVADEIKEVIIEDYIHTPKCEIVIRGQK